MSTLRINNIEAQSIPASPTIDEKVKVTNSSGDILVNIDGKTSGITTIGINTTDGNIKFDANSNVLITGILTATTLAGNFTPDSLEVGSNIKLGNAGVVTATSFVGSGANLTGITQTTINNNAANKVIMGSNTANTLEAVAKSTLFGNLSHGQNFLDDQNLVFGDASDMILIHTSSGAKSRLRNTNDSGSLDIESTLTRFLNKDGSTEKLRITSGGFIGAGTANPRRQFHLHNSASATVGFQMTNGNTGESNDSQGFQLKVGSDSHAEISQMENSDLRIFTNATERLRIGSSGQIGIAGANYGTSGQVLTSAGSGSAPTWKGGGGLQVLEQFSSPADGSSFTTSNGTVTVQNPTDWQALNTTLTDAQGSVITYQPPTGTVQVIYEFQYHIASDTDSNAILGARLLYDGNEITHSRFGQRGGTNYFDQLNTFKWVFNIGGSTDYSVGRLASWTSGKVIKLQMSEYNSSYEFAINLLRNYGSSGAINVFRRPIISITAIGTPS